MVALCHGASDEFKKGYVLDAEGPPPLPSI